MTSTLNTHRRGPARHSTRSIGREWRALAWLGRHPCFLLLPALLALAVVRFGSLPVGAAIGAVGLVLVVWARLHPPTFDYWIAPRLRRHWRRWTVYRGRRCISLPATRRADPGPGRQEGAPSTIPGGCSGKRLYPNVAPAAPSP